MPELPDVEVYRRTLARSCLHRTLARVEVSDARMLHGTSAAALGRALRGHEWTGTARRGKHLLVSLSGGGLLVLHFGMTGRLELDDRAEDDHTRVLFDFEDGRRLGLVDQRRLGRVALADSEEQYAADQDLGPDALSLSAGDLADLARQRRGSLNGLLMDQSRICGIGNVYSDEICFQARLDPTRAVASLDDADLRRLHRQLGRVLRLAVERGADPGQMPRTWLTPRRVDGARCPRDRGTVRAYSSGGRRGFRCPDCQA